MQKLCTTIAVLLLGSGLLLALSDTSLTFRAAGVDVATQKYYLQWSIPNVSDTADIKGFQILKLKEDGLGNVKMDTLAEVDSHALRFVDTSSPCCEPNIYTIRLMPKDVSVSTTHRAPFRTMQLSEVALDSCAGAINLRWSSYQQLDPFSTAPIPLPSFAGEVRYHIYGYIGGSVFKPDSAVWLATSGGEASFALPAAKEKQYYHLYVAAVYNNGSDTSYSNVSPGVFVPLPVRPQYIRLDSVLGVKESVTLHFRIDPATDYTRFWAEKSPEINGAYTLVEEFGSKQQSSITDKSPDGGYYFYRISAVNTCGHVTLSSPAVTNLVPAVLSEFSGSVSWNKVVWYSGGSTQREAQRYDVYRTSPPQLAGFVDSTSATSISQDFSQFPDSVLCSNQLCYMVEAFVLDDRQQPITRVRSPEVCNATNAQVSIPNAIQLSSEAPPNPRTGKSRSRFEPLCTCMRGYMLYIYTPSGRPVYAGAKPWSGREKNDGNFVPEGSYIYHIKITFVDGSNTERTGTVTVIY
ncbi:MAG: hypothetical protein LBJ57_02910 [Prevotellaceae bacterium]|jgi:hypothetical protein|nr:hypothetical protein [Prevotellaceae bacterium]